MKNKEMVLNIQGINKLLKNERPLPSKLNYAINRNLVELEKIAEPYIATLATIRKKYDEHPDDVAMEEEINELLDIENEMNIHMVTADSIPDGLTAMELRSIIFMVKDQESEE